MDPLIWGPTSWNFLHFITISYPDNPTQNDINNHKIFLKNLSNILPCSICKTHFNKHITESDLDKALSSKENYMILMWNIHNKVNNLNNRPIMKYNDFLNEYNNIIKYGNFNPIALYKKNKIYYYSLLVVFIIITLLILYYFISTKKV